MSKTQPPHWRRGEAPSNPEFPWISMFWHICISMYILIPWIRYCFSSRYYPYKFWMFLFTHYGKSGVAPPGLTEPICEFSHLESIFLDFWILSHNSGVILKIYKIRFSERNQFTGSHGCAHCNWKQDEQKLFPDSLLFSEFWKIILLYSSLSNVNMFVPEYDKLFFLRYLRIYFFFQTIFCVPKSCV